MNTLALKYRPRVLADLVGQEASVKALSNALRRAQSTGRIHHQAFLFAGVRGTGKTSSARIMARSLNCIHGPTPEPCGVCDPCRATEQPDLNLDIIEIDAASRASVEDARALREQVQTRPAFCRYRVYIIDEVHMLSRSAFDALLKILEEPPAHAVFVLATTELQDVPDTIKSRVQIYPFRLIPVGLIQGRLEAVCKAEGVTWDEASLRLVAEAGQGSMRDALTTLDRVIAAGDGHVREDLVREQLGIVPAVQVQQTLAAVLAGDAGGVLDQCAALASLGTDWVSFWKELMLAFRDHLEREARKGSPQETLRLARALHLLLQRERDLRDASLPQVVVELALVTAAQLPHLVSLDALVRSGGPASGPPPRRPEAGAAPRAAVPPAAVPAAPASLPALPVSEEELKQRCSDALRAAQGTLSRTLSSLPHLASRLSFEGGTLRFHFGPNVRNSAQELEREQANPHLISVLRAALPGLQRVALTFESAAGQRPEDVLKEDPAFQRLLQAVGGEITQVRREP
ncbi:MAG: DNA polymerase III subunit tau [Acidobacteria bacterium ADurb.Bin340]|jgi:DNA polymerase III subunit gamma/tau|nr:MAG: DNA polymerase III subunit tau [Acidobacteria bacterium ADurb.Bin340]